MAAPIDCCRERIAKGWLKRAPTAGLVAIALTTLPGQAHPAEWRIEAMLGAAWNAPLPIVIRQRGSSDLKLRARWATRAFKPPLYYAIRVERDRWSLELVHHKLYLLDPPSEVQNFEISHGYNLVVIRRRLGDSELHGALGIGAVISHPENTVRGRSFHRRSLGGYQLSGPVIEGAMGRDIGTRLWRGAGEIAMSGAWARVGVADGSADVPNLALHGRCGAAFCPR